MNYLTELLVKTGLVKNMAVSKLGLTNRSWITISPDSNIEKMIFRKNDQLLVLVDGDFVKGKWEFLAQDNSILLEFGDTIELFTCSIIKSDVLCLLNQKNKGIQFLVGRDRLVKLNLDKFLKELLYEKLEIRTSLLNNDQKLEILNVSESSKVGLTGKEVLINLQPVNDGIYYRKDGTFKFVIKDSKISNIIKINE